MVGSEGRKEGVEEVSLEEGVRGNVMSEKLLTPICPSDVRYFAVLCIEDAVNDLPLG